MSPWDGELDRLIGGEPGAHSKRYLRGLLAPTPRRNGWTIFEHVGAKEPKALQRFLNSTRWDAAELLAINRVYRDIGWQLRIGHAVGRLLPAVPRDHYAASSLSDSMASAADRCRDPPSTGGQDVSQATHSGPSRGRLVGTATVWVPLSITVSIGEPRQTATVSPPTY